MKYRVYIDVSKPFCYTVDAESVSAAEEKAKKIAHDENWGVLELTVFDIEEVMED